MGCMKQSKDNPDAHTSIKLCDLRKQVFLPGFIYCAYFSLVVNQAGKPENKYSISIIRKHESER